MQFLLRAYSPAWRPHRTMDTEMQTKSDLDTPPDHSALLMMLAYVEAECRRLGADAAARHAAMAAALMPGGERSAASALH